MAEYVGVLPKGDTSWIYVGTGAPEKHAKPTKKDTAFNRLMQRVFDVQKSPDKKSLTEAVQIQSELALEAAHDLTDGTTAWNRYKEHGSIKRFVRELDRELRGRENVEAKAKVLTFGLLGSAALGLDVAGDFVAEKVLFAQDTIPLPFGRALELNHGTGNRKALSVGWEMLTDKFSELLANEGAKQVTNRKDVGFISPLSSTLTLVGNTALNMLDLTIGKDRNFSTKVLNAVVNPTFVESSFRVAGAVPVLGVPVEKLYALANKQLLRDEGFLPFMMTVAFNMITAKDGDKVRK